MTFSVIMLKIRGEFMYLKALEIQGFKSFPDKIVLNFENGITAIVGPNGSGKSNVADAIRWVLGEQSTKTLRGGKMEDVIFKGTSTRSQMGFAQVSMILSNEDGALARDESEVVVTRRYYRSGESEYFINRVQVRLRDVHELFMDTGLGRDGYSMVGQGRIDEILSVKSEDRREIFEEAAGISKFRHRKEEAERKLLHTEENLVRVGDKISELELQIGPLKTQSENAKKYLIYRDELRGLEVTSWLNRLDRIEEDFTKLNESLKGAQDLSKENQERIESLYRDTDELNEQMQTLSVDVESVRGEIDALEAICSEKESAVAVTENTIEHHQQSILRIQQESQDRENQVQQLTEQILLAKKREEELLEQQKKSREELDRLQSEARKRAGESDSVTEKLTALREEAETERSLRNIAESRIHADETLLKELSDRESQLSSALEEATRLLEEHQKNLDENEKQTQEVLERLESVGNMIRGYSLRSETRRKKLSEISAEVMKLQAQYESVHARVQMLQEMEKEYEGYSGAVKTVMQSADRGTLKNILGPISSLISVPGKYAVAIEIALGAAMQNIVVKKQEDAKQAIEYLKMKNAGRATFYPLDVIRGRLLEEKGAEKEKGAEGIASELVRYDPAYEQVVRSLLGRILIVDQLDHGLAIARKYQHRFRIVTLDGQVLNAGGSMTGGSVSRKSGIFSRKNELEKSREAQTQMETDLDALLKQQDECRRETDKAEYELEVAQGQSRTAEDEKLRLESEGRYLKILLENGTQEKNRLSDERKETQKRMESCNASLNSEKSESEKRRETLEKLEQEISELESKAEEIDLKESGVSDALSKLRETLASVETEMQSGRSSQSQLEQVLRDLSGDYEQRLQLVSDYEQKINDLTGTEAQLKKDLQEDRRKQEALREKMRDLSARRMQVEGDRSRKDREIQDRNREQMNYERECGSLEQQIQRIEMEKQQLQDRMWENYELTYSTAQQLRVEVPNQKEHDSRIRELRSKIGRLGTPNLGAIDEYARVSERYEYLTSQRDDVEKSKRELSEIISGLSGEMEKIFSAEFKKINQSFSETFVEIFGGGKAQLELEDPDHILECGIEIKVQLPGKRLETLSLLSGGERAFIAIALYFSIIKVRPTPFCLLDEIDAALDEVNVSRYASYMKRLTQNTQFIVITHRRGTMEEADMLYGVAMKRQGSEEGVSKVLSLRLSEVEKTLNIKI